MKSCALVLLVTFALGSSVKLSKQERKMFLAHSDACLASSGASAEAVAGLVAGAEARAGAEADAALKRHVLCVLMRCKLVGKDGKLLKSSARPKAAPGVSKVLDNCVQQLGDSPEQLAWNLFRCGLANKAMLLAHMAPTSAGGN